MASDNNSKIVAIIVILWSMIQSSEYDQQNGNHFPVYSTQSCPIKEADMNKRSSILKSTESKSHMCVPNENFTDLLELCYIKSRLSALKGRCLFSNHKYSILDIYRCHSFAYGCPQFETLSKTMHEYKSCVTTVDSCLLANPSCIRKSYSTTKLYSTRKLYSIRKLYSTTTETGNRYYTWLKDIGASD